MKIFNLTKGNQTSESEQKNEIQVKSNYTSEYELKSEIQKKNEILVEGLQWWIDEIDEKRYISLIQDREDLETA